MDKLAKLQELIKLADSGLTRAEFEQAFKVLIEFIKKTDSTLSSKIDDKLGVAESKLNDLEQKALNKLSQVEADSETTLSNVKKWALESVVKLVAKSGLDKKLAEVDSKLSELNDKEWPDASTIALEASTMAQEALKPLIPTIPNLEEELPKLGEPIRDSLELLEGEERLDKSAIKGLDDLVDGLRGEFRNIPNGLAKNISVQNAGVTVSNLANTLDFTGAGINSITASGTKVTIDISGGGGGGGSGGFRDTFNTDGLTGTYTLSQPLVAGTSSVYLNGDLQLLGTHYNEVGNDIVFVSIPPAGGNVIVAYNVTVAAIIPGTGNPGAPDFSMQYRVNATTFGGSDLTYNSALGHYGIGTAATTNDAWKFSKTLTPAAGTTVGQRIESFTDASADGTIHVGQLLQGGDLVTNTKNYDQIGGSQSLAVHKGTGLVQELIGSVSDTQITGTGDVNWAYSSITRIISDFGSTGSMTGGAIGQWILSPTWYGGGTIANLYGLYIDPQTVGTSSNYAIYYNQGPTGFYVTGGGKTGVGVESPGRRFEVLGDALITLSTDQNVLLSNSAPTEGLQEFKTFVESQTGTINWTNNLSTLSSGVGKTAGTGIGYSVQVSSNIGDTSGGTYIGYQVQSIAGGSAFKKAITVGSGWTSAMEIDGAPIKWIGGKALVASDYSITRDADATNNLHLNVPTGAGFELSVNDVQMMALSSTGDLTVAGSITTSTQKLQTITVLYDFAVDGGTVGDNTMTGTATIPANAVLYSFSCDVLTPFASGTSSADFKLIVPTDGDVTSVQGVGYYSGGSLLLTPAIVKTTASRNVGFNVANENMTAGKARFQLNYYIST